MRTTTLDDPISTNKRRKLNPLPKPPLLVLSDGVTGDSQCFSERKDSTEGVNPSLSTSNLTRDSIADSYLRRIHDWLHPSHHHRCIRSTNIPTLCDSREIKNTHDDDNDHHHHLTAARKEQYQRAKDNHHDYHHPCRPHRHCDEMNPSHLYHSLWPLLFRIQSHFQFNHHYHHHHSHPRRKGYPIIHDPFSSSISVMTLILVCLVLSMSVPLMAVAKPFEPTSELMTQLHNQMQPIHDDNYDSMNRDWKRRLLRATDPPDDSSYQSITQPQFNWRHALLDEHNRLRSDIAQGSFSDDGFPMASDMDSMIYSYALESMAVAYSSNCRLDHTSQQSRRSAAQSLIDADVLEFGAFLEYSNIGENIAVIMNDDDNEGSSLFRNLTYDSLQQSVRQQWWMDRYQLLNFNHRTSFAANGNGAVNTVQDSVERSMSEACQSSESDLGDDSTTLCDAAANMAYSRGRYLGCAVNMCDEIIVPSMDNAVLQGQNALVVCFYWQFYEYWRINWANTYLPIYNGSDQTTENDWCKDCPSDRDECEDGRCQSECPAIEYYTCSPDQLECEPFYCIDSTIALRFCPQFCRVCDLEVSRTSESTCQEFEVCDCYRIGWKTSLEISDEFGDSCPEGYSLPQSYDDSSDCIVSSDLSLLAQSRVNPVSNERVYTRGVALSFPLEDCYCDWCTEEDTGCDECASIGTAILSDNNVVSSRKCGDVSQLFICLLDSASEAPSAAPSLLPSGTPTQSTGMPSVLSLPPTMIPTVVPSEHPTLTPTTSEPTSNPTGIPTIITGVPTEHPSIQPSLQPTLVSVNPTSNPTSTPTVMSLPPTQVPTQSTAQPTHSPLLSSEERYSVIALVPFVDGFSNQMMQRRRRMMQESIPHLDVSSVSYSMDLASLMSRSKEGFKTRHRSSKLVSFQRRMFGYRMTGVMSEECAGKQMFVLRVKAVRIPLLMIVEQSSDDDHSSLLLDMLRDWDGLMGRVDISIKYGLYKMESISLPLSILSMNGNHFEIGYSDSSSSSMIHDCQWSFHHNHHYHHSRSISLEWTVHLSQQQWLMESLLQSGLLRQSSVIGPRSREIHDLTELESVMKHSPSDHDGCRLRKVVISTIKAVMHPVLPNMTVEMDMTGHP